jgi:D-lactate dehydrogenase (cytochrome)
MSIDAALTEIALFLGNRLSRSKSDLETHGRSESHFPLTPPDGVAYPANTAEVARIVEVCSRNECPVIGWGTGTSLEGHALAFNGGLVIDIRDMNRVLAVHPEDMDVVVQPGITREELNVHLRDTGLFFPVDPAANASIGGHAGERHDVRAVWHDARQRHGLRSCAGQRKSDPVRQPGAQILDRL